MNTKDEQTAPQTQYFRKTEDGRYYEIKLSDYPQTIKTRGGSQYEELDNDVDGNLRIKITKKSYFGNGKYEEYQCYDRLYTEEYLKNELERYVKDHLPDLKELYERAPCSISFKQNPKYGDKFGYIAISEVKKNKYIIREKPKGEEFQPYRDNTNDPIIASYNNAEELLYDGWRLD